MFAAVATVKDWRAAPDFDGSPAPNLTLVVPQWSEQDFVTAIRTGVLPGGKSLDPDKMPYKEFSEIMTDTDLQALYQYIHGLPPTQAATSRAFTGGMTPPLPRNDTDTSGCCKIHQALT